MKTQARPDLSIVTTLYHSAQHVHEFHGRVLAVAERCGYRDVEIVYVNDASPDDAVDLVLKLHEEDPRVVVVDLARNAGHHRALMVGLEEARGRRVFLIDVDLEEPPELLEPMTARLDAETDLDVVYGVPEQRRGDLVSRAAATVFYGLLRWSADVEIPRDAATVRLMTRPYVDALLRFRERVLMIGGVFALAGFAQEPFPFRKGTSSPTTYDTARKARQAIQALTSFSDRPLRAILAVGLALVGTSLCVGVWATATRLLSDDPVHGFASLMISIWGLGGLILFLIGVLGTALARVYRQVKRRPAWIVRAVHDNGEVGA